MKLYAALVFSVCMGLQGNSQTTSKAEVDHAGTQRIADPSCDTAASSRPGLSRDRLVKAIIDQTICRGKFVTPEGIHGMTFVPISDRDRATVIALGVQALGSLTNIADTWRQLCTADRGTTDCGYWRPGRCSTFRASTRSQGLDADADGRSIRHQ
jgi:hypothetical protein